MKKIFLAYADSKMAYSLKRIGRQAKNLGIFDEICLMTPNDLPDEVKRLPLMTYSRGGGFWSWKPFIIQEVLSRHDEGDVVCYIDAGCTLKKSIEWTLYFELMNDYDTICFHYHDEMPQWDKFGCRSTKIKHWATKRCLQFLDDYVGSDAYRETNKVLGGILFFKKKNNPFINDWINVIKIAPWLLMDPALDEMDDQYPFFAQHKNDQPLVTALAWKYRSSCIALPELCETSGEHVAIYASRIRARNLKGYIADRIKYYARCLLGNQMMDKVRSIIKK